MDIAQRRNLAVVGLHHAGKTTLTEAILFHCGAVPRRGSVADGTATTDYEPECIGHAQSTSVAFAHATCGDVELILTDAPGFVDFLAETKIALLGVDAAIVVVDADPARIPHTRALIDFIEARKLPHMFFVNKVDRPGANPAATLDALVAAYGMHVVAEQLPNGAGETFTGVVDVVRDAGASGGAIAAAHGKLLEALGDFDDHLLEELLDGKEPPLDEVRKDLHDEYARDQIVPVLFGAAARGIGIAELLAAVVEQFPSPLDVEHADAGGRALDVKPAGPVVAQVVKTIVHPQSGKLSVARVLTGTLTGESVLTDTSRAGVQARPGGIYRLQGKKQEAVTSAGPGELVALARLDAVHTLDTLTTGGIRTVMPGIDLPEPVFAVAIAPRERLDDAKLSQMLARLVDEDPTLRLTRAEFTNELHLCGNGEVHVGIAAERLARKYHVAVDTRPPPKRTRATSTRPAVTANSARCAYASNRARAATASPSTRKSSAARCRANSSPRSRRAYAKRWRAALPASPSPTSTSRSTTARSTKSIRAKRRSRPPHRWRSATRCRSARRSCSSRSSRSRSSYPNRSPLRSSRNSPQNAASCSRSARPKTSAPTAS
jgi:elongation factor G